jgi:hypothetical protein
VVWISYWKVCVFFKASICFFFMTMRPSLCCILEHLLLLTYVPFYFYLICRSGAISLWASWWLPFCLSICKLMHILSFIVSIWDNLSFKMNGMSFIRITILLPLKFYSKMHRALPFSRISHLMTSTIEFPTCVCVHTYILIMLINVIRDAFGFSTITLYEYWMLLTNIY